MDKWQLLVSICAGLITFFTLIDKVGITKLYTKFDNDFKEMKASLKTVSNTIIEIEVLNLTQKKHTEALLAILRNDLYRTFKDNRHISAWTDDDCRIQTKMHDIYTALGGNGEEEIWWNKKKTWKIITDEEIEEIKNQVA